MTAIPWEERLAQAHEDEYMGPTLQSLKFMTLSSYLEGAAVKLRSPYPLWLLRRMCALPWGEKKWKLAPSARMHEVVRCLQDNILPDTVSQAEAMIFRLFCEIPYRLDCKQKGDAL